MSNCAHPPKQARDVLAIQYIQTLQDHNTLHARLAKQQALSPPSKKPKSKRCVASRGTCSKPSPCTRNDWLSAPASRDAIPRRPTTSASAPDVSQTSPPEQTPRPLAGVRAREQGCRCVSDRSSRAPLHCVCRVTVRNLGTVSGGVRGWGVIGSAVGWVGAREGVSVRVVVVVCCVVGFSCLSCCKLLLIRSFCRAGSPSSCLSHFLLLQSRCASCEHWENNASHCRQCAALYQTQAIWKPASSKTPCRRDYRAFTTMFEISYNDQSLALSVALLHHHRLFRLPIAFFLVPLHEQQHVLRLDQIIDQAHRKHHQPLRSTTSPECSFHHGANEIMPTHPPHP